MLIIENPLVMLIIALVIMICFLLFFKVVNFCEKINAKSKPKSDKKSSATKSEKVTEIKEDNNKIKTEELEKSEDVPFDSKSMTNYLYDRFVVDPTIDDSTKYQSNISEAFISEEKYSEIRNNKVHIRVEPVENPICQRNRIYDKINELTNNNRQEKEKLLDEFQNLSKEMKLLLIENIMQKID